MFVLAVLIFVQVTAARGSLSVVQASVEGFCKHLSVSRDKALDLIGQSVTIATIARDSFVQQDCKKVCRCATLYMASNGLMLLKLCVLEHVHAPRLTRKA